MSNLHVSNTALNSTDEKILNLLGSGIEPKSVAAAVGVSESRISQLMSDEHFSSLVIERRYNNLQQHTLRDQKYDSLEDQLLEKLQDSLPMMFKPEQILRAIQTVNAAKRRGQTAPESINNQQTVVTINVPTRIMQNFTINPIGQVIKAGQQDLTTIQSGTLLKQVKSAAQARDQQLIENSENILNMQIPAITPDVMTAQNLGKQNDSNTIGAEAAIASREQREGTETSVEYSKEFNL